MRRLYHLYKGTIGKKAIVGVTGAIMLGFLVGHVVGNLKVFLPSSEPGVADIDTYAAFLRSVGEPALPHGSVLWTVRVVLLLAAALHVICVVQLARRNRAARPVGYRKVAYVGVTRPARWMMFSGLLLLAFIVFHILHFTTGTIDPQAFREGAVYANLHAAFTRWPFVALYLAGMSFVALHVYHGAWSMFQSLGLDNPDRNRWLRAVALIAAAGLFIGFVAVPLSFILGALDDPPLAPVAVVSRSSTAPSMVAREPR